MFSVSQICQWIGGRVANAEALGSALEQIRVKRPAPLGKSRSEDLAFFFSKSFQNELPTARPGILITGEPFVAPMAAAGLPFWKTAAVIACPDPYSAMAILSEKFAAQLSTVVHTAADTAAEMAETFGKPQIHPTAVVDPTAELGAGVKIGPHVVISENVRVGAGSVLYAGVFVGPCCTVGERCVLFPNVALYEHVQLGNGVRIHANSVLGADGFGYAPKAEKTPDGQIRVTGHRKIYHLGRVIVGDDVEIGALSCIDRGTIDDTRVDRGAKIDNQVHLGHNTHVAEGAVICGASAMAGSSSVGKFAYVGGLTGIADHVHIGDGARVGAMSLVSKDVPPGSTAVGNPQREHREHFRLQAMLNKMVKGGRKKGQEGPT
jgi:UDP-3-O-[3-hydroxymyristoyl] glucosamine N-acyltransferase